MLDDAAAAVEVLLRALELKDGESREHSERVGRIARAIARVAGRHHVATCAGALDGFALHDAGKLGIPDAILCKPGPLDEAERACARMHPLHGAFLVEPMGGCLCGLEVVRHHHERWDGNGYPDGLSGSAIPEAARIFAIADAIDAMLSDRPYRAALSPDRIAEEIRAGAGTQFEPALALAALARLREVLDAGAETSTAVA